MPESRIKVDERLVERAKSGDAEAFGQLHDRYAESVFRFLYSRLNNRMDAEDLFGEVFLRTWNSLPRYKSQGLPFSAYLFRIARNLLIDHYRKSNSEKHIDTQDIKASEVLQVSPYERLVTKQEIEELKDTLSLLREDYRDVLVMRFISGLSPEETAKAMGRSSGAVRVLQHRALKALRRQLGVDFE